MKTGAIQNVRVNHGSGDVLVAEQLLHRPNVVSVFQQVGSEAVSESVTARCLFFTPAARTARV